MTAIKLVNELPLEEQGNKTCKFCDRNEDNELLFGKFFTDGEELTAHYYCLLFASGLVQTDEVDEGILGFLIGDIEKEIERGTKLTCSKCKKKGATVGCCDKKCKRNYHFPCGSETRVLNQYFGAFQSFCIHHHPVQKVPALRGSRAVCTICLEDVMIDKPSYQVLWSPCCKKRAWFHRGCIQKLALSAGYFFACPMCSDDVVFVNEMKDMGIYVPNQDASWELEPNAFKELAQHHNTCDHQNCICPEGCTRDDDSDGSLWNLMLCISCGSKCLHIGCGNLDKDIIEWECDDCSVIAGETSSSYSRSRYLSNGLESCSPPIGNQANCSAAQGPQPGKEGQRNSSSGCSNDDDDSDVEIIAIIPAPARSSSCAQSLRYFSKPSSVGCASGSQSKVRELPVKAETTELSRTGDDGRVTTNSPFHSCETSINTSTAEFISCSAIEEITVVADSLEATGNTPLISCAENSVVGVKSSEPPNCAVTQAVRNTVAERAGCVPSVATNCCQDLSEINHLNIKAENDSITLSNELGATDLALDPLQVGQIPANNESNKEPEEAPPKNPTHQIVEVTTLNYQGFTIKIFSDVISENNNHPRRFYFEPIVLLDPQSVIIQSQQLLVQQNIVRFSIQMWNSEIRSKVLDHLRHKKFEPDEDNVSVMPYKTVNLVGEAGRMQQSFKILEEATSYHRQNEKLDFFLLCDSSSTAQFIGYRLRHCPEMFVRECKLALECRGLSLNQSMANEASDTEHPLFKLYVSTVQTVEPPQNFVLAHERHGTTRKNHKQHRNIISEDATVSQVFPDIGSGGCMTIPHSPRSGSVPNEPAISSSSQLQPPLLQFPNSQHGFAPSSFQQQKKKRSPTFSSSTNFNNAKRPREQTYSQASVTRNGASPAISYRSNGLAPRPTLPVSLPLWLLPNGPVATWTPQHLPDNFASLSATDEGEVLLARDRQVNVVRERERDRPKI